jgi:hypothetical protein
MTSRVRAAPFSAAGNGFGFVNAWPSQPAISESTPFGTIELGNAKGGLCGGMVFASLDYWHAGLPPPVDQAAAGTPLYSFIVRRLVDSWHVPAGIMQYVQWMNLPDGDVGFDAFGRRVVVERGLAWRTIRQQWPQIRTDLDRGIPAALGLVTVASHDVRKLGLNHQVLACGYHVDGSTTTLDVYDPNRGAVDGVTISFDPSHPTKPTSFPHDLGIGEPVRGFFKTAYSPAPPPA